MPHDHLLRPEFLQLEQRLRLDWAQGLPIPAGLKNYRKAWLDTFEADFRPTDDKELGAAIQRANPTLVGDFHSLRRARLALGKLIRSFPGNQSPALLLELLPAGRVWTAEDLLERRGVRLVDGRRAATVYRAPLQELAERQGLVAGAWVEGRPQARDAEAAHRWRDLQDSYPDSSWLLFFGDWHLAEPHLPRRLRQLGADPLVLHQSPEPLWDRVSQEQTADFYEIGHGHWAWLHTPPLAQWASALLGQVAGDPEREAEAAEELIEALSHRIAATLQLPDPKHPPCVWPTSEWEGFRATLPTHDRLALPEHPAPSLPIFHPHQSTCWFPTSPSLGGLLEAAGHALALGHPLGREASPPHRFAARLFRRLVALQLHPCLAPPTWQQVAQASGTATDISMLPNPKELLQAWSQHEFPFLEPRQRWLSAEVLGAQAASVLAKQSANSKTLKKLLAGDLDCLDWAALAARMHAA